MKRELLMINGVILSFLGNVLIFPAHVKSADYISFKSGILSRTIPVRSFETLSKDNKVEGTLKNLIQITKQDPEELSKLLNQRFELPLIVTSKLIYSSIGEVFILRAATIIHPTKIKDKKITIPAIRSAIIDATVKGNGSLTLIEFFKSYPNKKLTIDIPALLQVLDKIDSMSELVEFFAKSPLEGIKKNKINL